MIGLLLKDFYSLRSYLIKQGILMFFIYFFIGLAMQNLSFLPSMLTMTTVMLLMSTFAVDESSHFYSFALTLPLTIHEIVIEKYILFFGALCGSSILSSLICTLLDCVTFQIGALIIWGTSIVTTLIYMIIACFLLPLLFKLGVEKARIWMTMITMVPFFLVIWGASWLPSSGIPMPSMQQLSSLALPIAGCVLLFCVALIFISYRISIAFFSSKEF